VRHREAVGRITAFVEINRDAREDLARFILRIKHDLRIAMIWIEHDLQMVVPVRLICSSRSPCISSSMRTR
jgi:hypothetical protein